jgi:hypothetical protein
MPKATTFSFHLRPRATDISIGGEGLSVAGGYDPWVMVCRAAAGRAPLPA